MNPEAAIRYVKVAVWREGAQGGSGWYDLELSCGHRMSCSTGMLTAALMCIVCVRDLVARPED